MNKDPIGDEEFRKMKKTFLILFFVFNFIFFAHNVSATTVTNRADGTFLLDGQPYFPIGFSPQSLVYNVPTSDWQDLKNNGINFTNDGNNPYRFAELNTKLKANGLNVTIISYGPGHSAFDATTQSNLAKNENNFLGYYGYDEPPVQDPVSPERQTYYQTIFQNDPNHFIWTNHFANDKPYLPDFDQNFWEGLKRWNFQTRTSVTGADVYSGNWEAVGFFTSLHKGFSDTVIPQLQQFRPGINGGIMMILSGYNRLWGVELPSFSRLNGTVDAIIHGTNGLMFYFDNADYILDNYYEPGVTKPSWITDANWTKYKNSNAYSEVKQIASFLKEAYPGLTGTKNTSITANLPILAKNGTDNKLYLFLANESVNDIQASIQNLPANTNFYEIITKRTVSSSQLSSFTFPKYSTQIYVQGTPTPQTCTQKCGANYIATCNSFANSCSNTACGGQTTNPNYCVQRTSQIVYNANEVSNCGNNSCTCYTCTNVNLSCAAGCNLGNCTCNPPPGDFNNDSRVNILDLRYFLTKFLSAYSIFDYNKLVENFGR